MDLEDDPPDDQSDSGSPGPVGTGNYEVVQGDCMSSIGFANGFFWRTLWDHPANRELKNARQNPNVLLPGDRVYIPPLEIKQEPRATDKRHTFVRKGVPARFTIVLQDLGTPRANEHYTLVIDGKFQEGVTDKNGTISTFISPNARGGRLLIGDNNDEILIDFGNIDPISEISGVQSRLKNLGFFDHGTPCVNGVALSAPGVVGGMSVDGIVQLTDAAPDGGVAVNLLTDNPTVQANSSVRVQGGRMSAPFTVDTSKGVVPSAATISAVGACGGSSVSLSVVTAPCVTGIAFVSLRHHGRRRRHWYGHAQFRRAHRGLGGASKE